MDKNIVLIGMPGCGKSTVGYKLAKKLNMKFIDIDSLIEEKEGQTISSLFKHGEDFFRQIESKYVAGLSNLQSTVIATGGGVVENPENMLSLRNNSVIIYINRKINDILSDLNDSTRPMLNGKKERLYELYDSRHSLYQKYCDIEISNDCDLSSLIDRIYHIVLRG